MFVTITIRWECMLRRVKGSVQAGIQCNILSNAKSGSYIYGNQPDANLSIYGWLSQPEELKIDRAS